MGTPVMPSHNLTVLSVPFQNSAVSLNGDPEEASREPSGENVRSRMVPEWPLRVAIITPVATFHNITVLSNDPEASREPSGENIKSSMGPE